jgi:sugar phosphate isomerase/epimerase
MRFAICNELFEGWDFRRQVEFVKKTGYDGLELAPFTFADSVTEISADRRKELKTIAADAGLELTGLHWLLVKPPGLHITHPDKAIRAKTVDYLKHLIDFCGDVGGKVMVFGSPNQRKILPEITRDQGWQYAVESFAACGDTAAKRGVTLCLEALPESLTNVLNTNAEVIRMVRDINHPAIRMMVDVKSMCAESISIPENIRNSREFFRYVHANDANMRGPGFGDVDFKPILRTLQEVGYNGYVSVEVFDFKPDPETIARESLRYLRASLP